MPLDAAVPKIERVMPVGSIARAKPLAGGTFRATVPTTVRFTPEDTDSDPLDHIVELELDVRDGRLVCTQCVVVAGPAGPAVTTDALRRVPIGRYLRLVVHQDWFLVMEVDPNTSSMHPFQPPPADFAHSGMSDDVLREVARLYHWSLATGDAPLGLLEREYGIPHGKASRWIATARRRGFIKVDVDAG